MEATGPARGARRKWPAILAAIVFAISCAIFIVGVIGVANSAPCADIGPGGDLDKGCFNGPSENRTLTIIFFGLAILSSAAAVVISIAHMRGRASGTALARASGATGLLIAVSIAVPRLDSGAPLPPPGSYYPPAPSLAGEMSDQWSDFATAVDHACVTNYLAVERKSNAVYLASGLSKWSERKTEAADWYIRGLGQRSLYDDVVALGDPPARPHLFRRWLANVGMRADLMKKVSRAWARGDNRRITVASERMDALKIDANRLGQRFGLRICTSNGPGREPVGPDNRATADLLTTTDYLRRVDRVCLQRNAEENRLVRRGELEPNATVNLSLGETLAIAAIAPPSRDPQLRQRILSIKRALDREAISMIKRTAHSKTPNRTLARLERQVSRHADQAQVRLSRLGLLDCGNWGRAPAPSTLGG